MNEIDYQTCVKDGKVIVRECKPMPSLPPMGRARSITDFIGIQRQHIALLERQIAECRKYIHEACVLLTENEDPERFE